MAYEGEVTLGDFFTASRKKGKVGLPTLSVTLQNGLINRDDLDRKTDTTLSHEDHLFVKKGCLVYNMMRMWQGASGIAHHDGIVSPAYVVLAPKSNIDSLYASYLFKSSRLVYLFWAYSHGLTNDRLRLYFNDFKKIPVSIPPKTEQTKIAQILSTWDKAIETVEKLITNSQQQKKALMQQLLTGKRRFPGFEGEWKTYQLGEFASITMGSSPSSNAYNDICAGLPLLQGNADISARRSDPRVFTSQITKECHPGDILLSVRAPVGAVAQSLHHACIGRGIAALRAKNNHSQSFLYQWLLFFEPGWSSVSQGSTFESVNSADIKILRFAAPCKDEQECIASILAIADTEIESLEAQLNHLKLEKRALMQQLLTGRRRVTINAEEVATA